MELARTVCAALHEQIVQHRLQLSVAARGSSLFGTVVERTRGSAELCLELRVADGQRTDAVVECHSTTATCLLTLAGQSASGYQRPLHDLMSEPVQLRASGAESEQREQNQTEDR